MDFLELKQSKLVDTYMDKISVSNRNNRQAKSSKTSISDDVKQQILQMVNA